VLAQGELSVGELSFIDHQPQLTDEEVLVSLRYFQTTEDFVTSYVYPSVCLLQPLFSDADTSTDWALTDNWLPFLRRLQMLEVLTCQVNCTASYR